MDGKGRIALPTKWRDEFQSMDPHRRVFITRNREKPCCQIFPFAYFAPRLEKLSESLDVIGSESQEDEIRKLMMDATDSMFDEQWRLVLPPRLRKELELGSSLVAVSIVKGFELWNPADLEQIRPVRGQ